MEPKDLRFPRMSDAPQNKNTAQATRLLFPPLRCTRHGIGACRTAYLYALIYVMAKPTRQGCARTRAKKSEHKYAEQLHFTAATYIEETFCKVKQAHLMQPSEEEPSSAKPCHQTR